MQTATLTVIPTDGGELLDAASNIPLPVDTPDGELEDYHEREIKHSRLLRKTMGVEPRTLCRHPPALKGRIAIHIPSVKSKHEVVYLSPTSTRTRDANREDWFLPPFPMQMAERLSNQHERIIDRLHRLASAPDSETTILTEFLEADETPGTPRSTTRERWIGGPQPAPTYPGGCAPRRPDAIIENTNEQIIIEVKRCWDSGSISTLIGQLSAANTIYHGELSAQPGPTPSVSTIGVVGELGWDPRRGWPGVALDVVQSFDLNGIALYARSHEDGEWMNLTRMISA